MITITTKNRSDISRIEFFMENEVLRNVNLNGAQYKVIAGDYDAIDGVNEIVGTSLFIAIFNNDDHA